MWTYSFLEGAGWAPEHWLKLLEKHDVQHVALSARSDGELVTRLLLSGAWEVEWEDGETILLSRIEPLQGAHSPSDQPCMPR